MLACFSSAPSAKASEPRLFGSSSSEQQKQHSTARHLIKPYTSQPLAKERLPAQPPITHPPSTFTTGRERACVRARRSGEGASLSSRALADAGAAARNNAHPQRHAILPGAGTGAAGAGRGAGAVGSRRQKGMGAGQRGRRRPARLLAVAAEGAATAAAFAAARGAHNIIGRQGTRDSSWSKEPQRLGRRSRSAEKRWRRIGAAHENVGGGGGGGPAEPGGTALPAARGAWVLCRSLVNRSIDRSINQSHKPI